LIVPQGRAYGRINAGAGSGFGNGSCGIPAGGYLREEASPAERVRARWVNQEADSPIGSKIINANQELKPTKRTLGGYDHQNCFAIQVVATLRGPQIVFS